jgi:hypothetical protein
MHGRDHFLPTIIQYLSERPETSDTAVIIEYKMINRLLERLTIGSAMFGLDEELSVLLFAGDILSRRAGGTNFLRNKINPLLDRYAGILENGRMPDVAPRALVAGFCLTVVGLELVRAGKDINPGFRSGITTDYIHLLGRLLSSLTCREIFEAHKLPFPGEDVALEALKIGHELAGIPELNVRTAMDLLLSDPHIPSKFTSFQV